MTARFKILLIIALALATGCRCTVAVSFGGDAESVQEAGKQYGEGVDISPDLDLDIPFVP